MERPAQYRYSAYTSFFMQPTCSVKQDDATYPQALCLSVSPTWCHRLAQHPRETGTTSSPDWHNILMGLAQHPHEMKLAQRKQQQQKQLKNKQTKKRWQQPLLFQKYFTPRNVCTVSFVIRRTSMQLRTAAAISKTSVSIMPQLGANYTSLALSLPRCHLKTTDKNAKFQILQPFSFLPVLASERMSVKTHSNRSIFV